MSALSNLMPLIILFGIMGGGAFLLYQISVWSNTLADRSKKHLEKKHMTFTKEGGLKVGVKEMGNEAYEDKTQNVLVNVWNNAQKGSAGTKPSTSRTNSSQARPNSARTSSGANISGAAANLSPPASRGGQQRSASPVPGSW